MWFVAGAAASLPERGIWRKVPEGKQDTCSLEVAGLGGIVGVDPWMVGMVVVEGTI